jgi:hypothetical protein
MKESIMDLLRRIARVLHFFKMYDESQRLVMLECWLDNKWEDIPEDVR